MNNKLSYRKETVRRATAAWVSFGHI